MLLKCNFAIHKMGVYSPFLSLAILLAAAKSECNKASICLILGLRSWVCLIESFKAVLCSCYVKQVVLLSQQRVSS